MKTFTAQELEAMTTEELSSLVAGMCLNTNGDRRFLIENILLGQTYPNYIKQLQQSKGK